MWERIKQFARSLIHRPVGLLRWEVGWKDSNGRHGAPSLSTLASARTVPASIELTITFEDGSTVSLIGQGISTQSREVPEVAGVTSMLSLRPAVRAYSRNDEAAGIAGRIDSVVVKSCPMVLTAEEGPYQGLSGTLPSI